ncbi:hypothetical protein Tco_0709587 [Tanacetum coccineum]
MLPLRVTCLFLSMRVWSLTLELSHCWAVGDQLALCLGVPFAFACFPPFEGLLSCHPLLKLFCEVAFQHAFSEVTSFVVKMRFASRPGYSLLIVASSASVGNSTIDLIVETSMLSFYIAFLPNRTLYLEVGLTIWNGNMIVFVNGCVPTILLTLYEVMTSEIMNESVEGIKASHGILCDGVCRRSLLLSVTLSDRVDSILQMWLASSLGALTMVFFDAWNKQSNLPWLITLKFVFEFSTRVCVIPFVIVKPADCLSSFLLPPRSGRGLL